MSAAWLELEGPGGPRRAELLEGLTRIGGAGCEVVLPVEGADQLHLWDRPPRLLFLGRGARPLIGGVAREEHALASGDRIEWGGHVLTYREAPREAALVELEPLPGLDPSSQRLLARLRAGLACDLGLADAPAAKRWREAVVAGQFEPDACARELLGAPLAPESEQRLLERSASLLRDFLMAPTLAGLAGARRKARERTRGLLAFLVTQALALLVFALLVGAALVLIRARGTSLDAILDRLVPG